MKMHRRVPAYARTMLPFGALFIFSACNSFFTRNLFFPTRMAIKYAKSPVAGECVAVTVSLVDKAGRERNTPVI